MEQYSNLNVHGKIKQLESQANRTPDNEEVVRYDTLTGRVPATLPTPASADAGKAIIINANGDGYTTGEAGKVDAVQINGTPIAGDGAQTKIANIPKAASDTLGVIKVGSNLSINADGVLSGTAAANNGKLTIQDGQSTAIKAAEFTADQSGDTTLTVTGSGGTSVTGNSTTHTLTISSPSLGTGASNAAYGNHTHGNITTDGKLGTTANKLVVTTTGGVITAGSTTSPIGMSGTSIIHETSGAASTGNTVSKGSASKSVSVTVNEWGHVTSLSDQNITIAESQVTNLSTDLSTITGNISTINGKIPSEASSSNQLADKAFVNSSIGTSTANFLGTYNAVSDLGNSQSTVDGWSGSEDTTAQTLVAGQIASHLPSGTTATNNDYVYVAVDQTPTGDAGEDWFWRYKFSKPGSAAGTWVYEYTLNNSSFTADQWATINSLVSNTSDPKVGVDVKDINAHLGNTTIHVTSTDKTTWNGKQDAITGAASSITSNNLTASRVLVSDSNGKVAASSSVTTTELGYLDGVTENIQTQLDTKFDTIAQDSSGDYVSSIAVDGNDPSKLNVTRATLPTLSGGASAVNGKYVSGVTVSGHAVTVTQGDLPTLSKGTTTGSGNVVSDISVSGHQITLTKGVTALTSHQTIKQDGITGATINRYAVCSTSASTSAKTATLTSGTMPTLNASANGTRVTVKFTYGNTAEVPTLNISSSGAKNLYYRGVKLDELAVDHEISAGSILDLVYDNDTGWNIVQNGRQVYQKSTTMAKDFPLLLTGYYSTLMDSSVTEITRYNTSICANPSTGAITATTFNGALNGNATTATTATTATNWSGNPFAATDVTLADM